MKKTAKKSNKRKYTYNGLYDVGFGDYHDLGTLQLAKLIELYLDENCKSRTKGPLPDFTIADWIKNNWSKIDKSLEEHQKWLEMFCRVDKNGFAICD